MKLSKLTIMALAVFFTVVLIWVCYVPILNWLANNFGILHPQAWRERGLFGDTFGALNTLFTGLAFAAVLLSLIFQQQEISEQATQLSEQVKAQQKTASVLSSQMKIMAKAAQLSAFPALISAQEQLIKAMKADLPPDRGSRSLPAELDYQNARNAITQEEKKFEDLKKRILSLQEEIAALGQ